ENFYVNHFLRPQLESLGEGFTFVKPWRMEIFGWPISIGKCVNVLASADMKVRLSVWSDREGEGRIIIGDNVLICPGVRMSSAMEIRIGDNCMLARGAYLTDSDWHDIYNRIMPCRRPAPIRVEENVWIGDGAIICKGVTIGQNSVIGAGAVVVDDVPRNTIAAGNPARVVKELDANEKIVTRADWFKDPERLSRDIDYLEWNKHKHNTFLNWFTHLLFPARGD
ncbi:MAG: acyltransferase, partial [Pseudomonadota bacterium]